MADQTYTPPTLVSELKRLLGKRNLEKYFADDDGTILNGYVYNGIHALARKRQFWVKTSLTFDVPTNIVPIPANILLLKIVWKDDRTIRCLPTKSYEIYRVIITSSGSKTLPIGDILVTSISATMVISESIRNGKKSSSLQLLRLVARGTSLVLGYLLKPILSLTTAGT
jgi:hypothetical protein